MTEYHEQFIKISERLTSLEIQLERIKTDFEDFTKSVRTLERYASHWRGGFLFLIGIGSVGAWLLSQWRGIRELFR